MSEMFLKYPAGVILSKITSKYKYFFLKTGICAYSCKTTLPSHTFKVLRFYAQ